MITDMGTRAVGAAEIAKMFGVSRQRVTQLTAREDFPDPWEVLSMGKIWLTKDVREWAEQRGRAVLSEDGAAASKTRRKATPK